MANATAEVKVAPAATPAAEIAKGVAAETKVTAPPDASWAKPAEEKAAEEKKAGDKKPVDIKYDLKLPDGTFMDAASVEKLTSFAKERGLTNEQAQAILERDHAERAAFLESERAKLPEQNASWLEELQGDKEFGGAKFKENAEHAKRAFDYADPTGEFRKELEAAGLSNYPKLVKFASKLGRLMAEDRLGAGASGVPEKEMTPQQRLRARYEANGDKGDATK